MMPAAHLESALKQLQRIIIVASRPTSPITRQEALEQVAEELELAGFGSPEIYVASIADPEARSCPRLDLGNGMSHSRPADSGANTPVPGPAG